MKKLFPFLLLLLPVFQSCGNKTEEVGKPKKEVEKPKDSVNVVLPENPEKTVQYSISIERTDSVAYHSAAAKIKYKNGEIKKITDFEKAKKILKGIVEFADGDEDGESHAVKKIHFRNGKEYRNTNEYDFTYFVAYYPEEDILLCEGGHTTDVSFNLKNGKETEEAGNPDLIITSRNKAFRINGHFGGQECYFYFIQKKINGEFEKIIQLDEVFEKQTKTSLCVIENAFWLDDQTIYLTESSDYTDEKLNKRYFRVKITEQQ